MGLIIEDGLGRGFSTGVDKENRLLTSAVTEDEIEFHATQGLAFTWISTYTTASINEVIFSLMNTDTVKHIHVSNILLGSDVNQAWSIDNVLTGIAVGTPVVGVNTNTESGLTADAASFGNAAVTGVLTTQSFIKGVSLAGNNILIDTKSALLIQLNKTLVISASAIGTVYVTIMGYFEDNHV